MPLPAAEDTVLRDGRRACESLGANLSLACWLHAGYRRCLVAGQRSVRQMLAVCRSHTCCCVSDLVCCGRETSPVLRQCHLPPYAVAQKLGSMGELGVLSVGV